MLKPFLIFILLLSAYCVNCDESEQSNDDVFDDSIKEDNVVSFKTNYYYFQIFLMVNSGGRRNGIGSWKSNFRCVCY